MTLADIFAAVDSAKRSARWFNYQAGRDAEQLAEDEMLVLPAKRILKGVTK